MCAPPAANKTHRVAVLYLLALGSHEWLSVCFLWLCGLQISYQAYVQLISLLLILVVNPDSVLLKPSALFPVAMCAMTVVLTSLELAVDVSLERMPLCVYPLLALDAVVGQQLMRLAEDVRIWDVVLLRQLTAAIAWLTRVVLSTERRNVWVAVSQADCWYAVGMATIMLAAPLLQVCGSLCGFATRVQLPARHYFLLRAAALLPLLVRTFVASHLLWQPPLLFLSYMATKWAPQPTLYKLSPADAPDSCVLQVADPEDPVDNDKRL